MMRTMNAKRFALSLIERLCLILGLLLLAYAGAMLAYRHVYQAYAAWTFTPAVPLPGNRTLSLPLSEGMPVAKLEIPKLNFNSCAGRSCGLHARRCRRAHTRHTSSRTVR
jgi:hypothetical protein